MSAKTLLPPAFRDDAKQLVFAAPLMQAFLAVPKSGGDVTLHRRRPLSEWREAIKEDVQWTADGSSHLANQEAAAIRHLSWATATAQSSSIVPSVGEMWALLQAPEFESVPTGWMVHRRPYLPPALQDPPAKIAKGNQDLTPSTAGPDEVPVGQDHDHAKVDAVAAEEEKDLDPAVVDPVGIDTEEDLDRSKASAPAADSQKGLDLATTVAVKGEGRKDPDSSTVETVEVEARKARHRQAGFEKVVDVLKWCARAILFVFTLPLTIAATIWFRIDDRRTARRPSEPAKPTPRPAPVSSFMTLHPDCGPEDGG